MKKEAAQIYRSPQDGTVMKLNISKEEDGFITEGEFICGNGAKFNISEGIPDFTWPFDLADVDKETRALYDKLADEYDKFSSIPFQTFKTDEVKLRHNMVERLNIKQDSKVLEIGCGAGANSIFIAEMLEKSGALYLQDLSPRFLKKAISGMRNLRVNVEYSVANGCYLPFPERYFDAAFHFGGLNTFSDIRGCFSELARVVKPGGKVLVGDEGMAPWLRKTEFGKIMMNSNPLLKCEVPVNDLPVTASEVKVEWIMMGAFYLIEFTVSEAEPVGNYHINIPSRRGGTHWSRYYGQLEGVTDEAKNLALKAQEKSGKSMHEWLDKTVREAAAKEINKQGAADETF